MRNEVSWTSAGTIWRPPAAPIANAGTPSRVATTGHMLASGRLPGAIAFGRPGRGSNHIMPLFIRMPVDGSVTLAPKRDNRLLVSAAMLPSASITLTCEVQLSLVVPAWPKVSSRVA